MPQNAAVLTARARQSTATPRLDALEAALRAKIRTKLTSTYKTPGGVDFKFKNTAANMPPTPKADVSPLTSPRGIISPGDYDCVYDRPLTSPTQPPHSPLEQHCSFDDEPLKSDLLFAHNAITRAPTVVVPTPQDAGRRCSAMDWPDPMLTDDEDDWLGDDDWVP